MIEALLGSRSREQVLAFIVSRGEGYAGEIAQTYEVGVTPIKNQLEALELAGVLASQNAGRTVLYRINPRYAFKDELEALVKKAVSCYPEALQEKLLYARKRPRRQGKPL